MAMQIITRLILTLVLLAVGFLPQPAAADPCPPEYTTPYLGGQVFIAKKPLYDTKIAQDGIFKLERDKQEIPQGARFRVKDVECKKSQIKMTLRQEAPVKLSGVEIHFFFNIGQRAMPNGVEEFKKMTEFVFEKEKESDREND